MQNTRPPAPITACNFTSCMTGGPMANLWAKSQQSNWDGKVGQFERHFALGEIIEIHRERYVVVRVMDGVWPEMSSVVAQAEAA